MCDFTSDPVQDHDACGVGFIVRLGAAPSREVVDRALTALARLAHRGGVDADGQSGDGAGLLLPIPQEFFRASAKRDGIDLPEAFGLGMAFVESGRETEVRGAVEKSAREAGLQCLGWRDVPTDPSILEPRSGSTLPLIRQCFFGSVSTCGLERSLFFLRKRVQRENPAGIYFASLSSRTIVYKGLLAPLQLREFYPDLDEPDFTAAFAIFHQRYSTNTRPTWRLAQPFRFVAHNGEINTIGTNRRWMRARETHLRQELDAGDWFHALEEGVSDSASLDNAVELLLHRGYSVAAAMLRLVPPAAEFGHKSHWPDRRLRDFLTREAREQEPWDGPAALIFSDGNFVGTKLDRNGLRPLRYTLTGGGLLVLGSEAGLADFAGEPIVERKRLGPGGNARGQSDSRHDLSGKPDCWLSGGQRQGRFSQECGTREAIEKIPSQSCRQNARTEEDRRRPWLDRRPIPPPFSAVRYGRERGHLEHGRRRPASVYFGGATTFVGLLQAAVRASHESCH